MKRLLDHRGWPFWLLVLGCALAISPWRLRVRHTPPGIFAVAFAGPSAEALDDLGLIADLRNSSEPWRGEDLAVVPGARSNALWRRLETGMFKPKPDVRSLFESFHIPTFGSWSDAPDAERDSENLKAATRILDEGREPSAVLILTCSESIVGLADERCASMMREAGALARRRAAEGHFGLLLSMPLEGSPARGAVWVAGPDLKQGTHFRFREIDLVPTVLHLSGFAIPVTVDGVAAIDLFTDDFLFHHPIRYSGGGS